MKLLGNSKIGLVYQWPIYSSLYIQQLQLTVDFNLFLLILLLTHKYITLIHLNFAWSFVSERNKTIFSLFWNLRITSLWRDILQGFYFFYLFPFPSPSKKRLIFIFFLPYVCDSGIKLSHLYCFVSFNSIIAC